MNRIALAAAVTCFASSAFALKPIATPKTESSAKPPIQRLRHDGERVAFEVTLRPGVPDANATLAIEVEVEEILANPDPSFGTRRPLSEAQLEVTLVGPTPTKKKRRKGKQFADARIATPLRDPGTFAATFTPPSQGLYGLHIRGKDDGVGEFNHEIIVPVGVWPVPKDAAVPAIPADVPQASAGNLAHGKALCKEHCNKGVAGAQPTDGTPLFLASSMAAAKNDSELLATMAGKAANRLSPTEKTDLLFYLRSLHADVESFFPDTTHYMAKRFSINDYGKERLAKHGIKLSGATDEGVVFIVYKGESVGPTLIDYDDRIARDRLKKANKLGYVVFFEQNDSKLSEIGLVLGREPNYPIVQVIARDESGSRPSRLNKEFAVFTGQGAFNDPKSIKRGSSKWRKFLVPYYLRAAELATMYYGEEREFTAFDDEFN